MTLSGLPAGPQQLFDLALAHHKEGKLAQAEQLYLQVLAAESQHFNACHSLGILRAEQGRTAEAIELIGAALRIEPGSLAAWTNHGAVLSMAGRFEESLSSYERALAIRPGDIEAHRNHGKSLRELGRFAEALADYDLVLAAKPDDLDAIADRSDTCLRLRRLDEALAGYDRLLVSMPNEIYLLNCRGNVLRAMKRFAQAQASYDKAVAIAPNLAETLNNRGIALSDQGHLGEALESYDRALAKLPDSADTLTMRGFILNNRGKALCELDRVADGFADFARSADILYNISLTPPPATGSGLPHKLRHDQEQQAYLADESIVPMPANGSLRLVDGARLTTPAINPGLDAARIAEQWRTATPKILVLDDFLTEAALASLRRFCWGSTVWRTVFPDGYLGAFPEQGFACPLLAQIAEELRDALSPIFSGHPLRYLWAFKYDSELRGTTVHADQAVVNVNFWITPDEANLDPESGGLVVWDAATPPDWDFADYNGEAAPIREFLARKGAKSTTIPHRANRAVIFDSDLFHETDKIVFQPGYRNRRINITLLYGRRAGSDGN